MNEFTWLSTTNDSFIIVLACYEYRDFFLFLWLLLLCAIVARFSCFVISTSWFKFARVNWLVVYVVIVKPAIIFFQWLNPHFIVTSRHIYGLKLTWENSGIAVTQLWLLLYSFGVVMFMLFWNSFPHAGECGVEAGAALRPGSEDGNTTARGRCFRREKKSADGQVCCQYLRLPRSQTVRNAGKYICLPSPSLSWHHLWHHLFRCIVDLQLLWTVTFFFFFFF